MIYFYSKTFLPNDTFFIFGLALSGKDLMSCGVVLKRETEVEG